jgi:hypothetical protein
MSAETHSDEAGAEPVFEPSDAPPEMESESYSGSTLHEPEAAYEPPPISSSAPTPPAISTAIEQVSQIIEELKHALDEMEEVLETLEAAERQKIDDEREIESLQRALRQLHRSGHGGSHRR